MALAPQLSPAAIAVNRFGLGARPGETPDADPRGWLLAQADPKTSAYRPRPPALADQPTSAALALQFVKRERALRDARADAKTDNKTDEKIAVRKQYAQQLREDYRAAVDARVNSALTANAPFVERLVHFWANHFAVSVEKPPVTMLAGSFENEAIRPHVLGRFEDMLIAAEQHPAMQIFLDQPRSVGPDSPAAERAAMRDPERKRGLNENLAREIMELHTLGVRSGYTQADVTEFARALTGWSLGAMGPNAGKNPNDATPPGAFAFRANLHEPGARTIIGKRYAEDGLAQPLAVLRDLAASPATAQHVATKLARHFVADTPPPALVDRLARAFQTSGGDLPSVYRALIESPEAWTGASAKFKTPWDWTISSLRGLNRSDLHGMQAAPVLTQLGQQVWRPGSPAGYDDIAASWAAPDALVRRVEIAQRFAARAGDKIDARTLGPQLLPGALSDSTATAVSRAESAQTALALLLVSPDFMRR